MSRVLTISDELYERLENEARLRGFDNIEKLIEELEYSESSIRQRQEVIRQIDDLRERLFTQYGQMPDSTELLRTDRER